jgi:predicted alpha/beta-hydrolase family hydrolase
MRDYPASDSSSPLLVLAHGAGAGHDHPWMTRVASGLAARRIAVVTFNFPYMDAHRRAPDRAEVLEEAFRSAWSEVQSRLGTDPAALKRPMFAGGKSMGGRIASQAAARGLFDPAPAGLVFFGYPLHPPGKPAQRRDRHLLNITVPMLFLHGTRDPFGSPDELHELTTRLPASTLEIITGGDHSLVASTRDTSSIEHALDRAANWIQAAP